jgi:dUTP pyrophosphatase
MKVKRLTGTAKLPTRGSKGAAGLDLYADVPGTIAIYPHETKKINTGIAVELRRLSCITLRKKWQIR